MPYTPDRGFSRRKNPAILGAKTTRPGCANRVSTKFWRSLLRHSSFISSHRFDSPLYVRLARRALKMGGPAVLPDGRAEGDCAGALGVPRGGFPLVGVLGSCVIAGSFQVRRGVVQEGEIAPPPSGGWVKRSPAGDTAGPPVRFFKHSRGRVARRWGPSAGPGTRHRLSIRYLLNRRPPLQ